MRPDPNVVEVGWLVLGRLDDVDREAVLDARQRMLETVREQLVEFEWRMPLVERADIAIEPRAEPVELLAYGIDERDARHWDFVIAVTAAELVGYRKPYALATPSSAAGVAVLSTAQIDPRAVGEDLDAGERKRRISQRVWALALHLLGDLCGIEHDDEPGSAMAADSLNTIDAVQGYGERSLSALRVALAEVADLRLEEHRSPPLRARFYARAAWMNARVISEGIRRSRPWELPFRLSRFLTAAISATVVLLLTAETWELATHMSIPTLASIAAASLLLTIVYTAARQGLFMSRSRRLTEQIVIAHVSTAITLAIGMAVAYAVLFGMTLLLAELAFPTDVIRSWTNLRHIDTARCASLAVFVAAVSLAIGALGGTLEDQSYFRHVAYIDEEL